MERDKKFSSLIASDEKIICGLYPRTDDEGKLKFCYLISLDLFTGEALNNFFTIMGRVVYVSNDEKKLAIKE